MTVAAVKSDHIPACRRANIAEVAEFLIVTHNTVRAWVAKGMPYLTRGERGTPWEFDLLAVVRWRLGAEQGTADTNDPESLSPKERLDWYKGTRERLALERDRGDVIPADEVETTWVTLIATAKGRLMAIGPRVAQELADVSEAREIERRLKAIHKEILQELAGQANNADKEVLKRVIDLNKIKIGHSPLTDTLFLYRHGKDQMLALDKRECEPDLMFALIEHMMHNAPNGSEKTVTIGNRKYCVRVTPYN